LTDNPEIIQLSVFQHEACVQDLNFLQIGFSVGQYRIGFPFPKIRLERPLLKLDIDLLVFGFCEGLLCFGVLLGSESGNLTPAFL
jgi:hypothetical protein